MQAVYEKRSEIQTSASPTCPVCSAENNVEWGIRTSHKMFECLRCGVVFFDRKTFDLHSYQSYYEYTDTWDSARVQWEVKIRRRSLTKQLSHIRQHVDGRNLLDIGAGPGYLCHVANAEGWRAQGVELSEKAVRIGQEFLDVEYCQLDNVGEASIDVITCYHVLEHMERPDEFIRRLHSKLRPNGVVAVHVPHREPLSFAFRNRLHARTNGTSERLCQLYVPEHISGFTIDSLCTAFEIFGFRPLLVKTSAMWSVYYDPFFLRNYLRGHDYAGIVKHTLRSLIDNVGVAFGQGDWVVGHFRKA